MVKFIIRFAFCFTANYFPPSFLSAPREIISTEPSSFKYINLFPQSTVELKEYGESSCLLGIITDDTSKVIGHHWKNVMIIPVIIALVVAILFTIFFKNPKEEIDISKERLL